MDRIVERLTHYATELTFEDLPDHVVDRAKQLILDTFGCALGASTSQPAVIARRQAARVRAEQSATVMVGGEKSSPDLACFANGVMVRYLDYNDMWTGIGGGAHASDLLAPSLAAAEYAGGDGKELILGYVLGYEIFCALGDTTKQAGGWDQATYALIGASVLASKLMGLPPDKMEHALSLAVSSHLSIGQIRSGQISHWKGCAVANASRNAIFCTLLADDGMTGPNYVFEGPRGFMNQTGWQFEFPPLGGDGREFRLMRSRIKPFPAGYFSQSAIEAAIEMKKLIPSLDDVTEFRLETFPSGFSAMASDSSRWRPLTRETADHSLPFVLALAVREGNVEVRHYDEEYYKRPEILAVMDKITVSVGDESVAAWPDVPLNVLHARLTSGETLTTRGEHHLGHYLRPMSDADQERKFRPLAEGYAGLSPAQVDVLLERLRALEDEKDLSALVALTVPPTKSA
jgi:2-methylcitrate dehydratase